MRASNINGLSEGNNSLRYDIFIAFEFSFVSYQAFQVKHSIRACYIQVLFEVKTF